MEVELKYETNLVRTNKSVRIKKKKLGFEIKTFMEAGRILKRRLRKVPKSLISMLMKLKKS